MPLTLASCDDVLAHLAQFDDPEKSGALANASLPGGWTVGQVLAHCAQSIDASRTGYPSSKGWLFQRTIGRIAMRTFLRRGSMSHDRVGPIPGAPDIAATSIDEGLARIRRAIAAFRAHEADFAPHFAYGPVTREQYDRLHAMHVANHLAPLAT